MTLICACLLCTMAGTAQTKKTTLSAEIYGYQPEMIYFDCVQTPFLRAEFHTNPGEEHLYSFETDELLTLLINGRNVVLLAPGDSLHVNIQYDGKNVQSMEFSGTEQAVTQNRLYRDIYNLKRDMRYKSQLLTCAVLDVKPKARIDDSRILLAKVQEMVKAVQGLNADAAEYILAETDGAVYNSFMEYPPMYQETRKKPIAEQEIGDYWTLMDGYTLRDGNIALSCPEYISLLMRYVVYAGEKKAHENGGTYVRPAKFEDMYKEFAGFYDGDIRDAVLYNLICNFIRSGKEIERVDPILADYREKYNKCGKYLEVLDSLLQ